MNNKETKSNLSELIEALQIFLRYGDSSYPTSCEHDVLYVCVNPDIVSTEDKARLETLGFLYGDGEVDGVFYSYRYGS